MEIIYLIYLIYLRNRFTNPMFIILRISIPFNGKRRIPDIKKLPHEALHQRDLPVIFAYSDFLSLCRTSCGSPFNQLYHFARKRKA